MGILSVTLATAMYAPFPGTVSRPYRTVFWSWGPILYLLLVPGIALLAYAGWHGYVRRDRNHSYHWHRDYDYEFTGGSAGCGGCLLVIGVIGAVVDAGAWHWGQIGHIAFAIVAIWLTINLPIVAYRERRVNAKISAVLAFSWMTSGLLLPIDGTFAHLLTPILAVLAIAKLALGYPWALPVILVAFGVQILLVRGWRDQEARALSELVFSIAACGLIYHSVTLPSPGKIKERLGLHESWIVYSEERNKDNEIVKTSFDWNKEADAEHYISSFFANLSEFRRCDVVSVEAAGTVDCNALRSALEPAYPALMRGQTAALGGGVLTFLAALGVSSAVAAARRKATAASGQK